MAKKRNQISENQNWSMRDKRFMRVPEAAAFFSVGLNTLNSLAKEAGAKYHYGKITLIDVKKIEQHLENYHDESDDMF